MWSLFGNQNSAQRLEYSETGFCLYHGGSHFVFHDANITCVYFIAPCSKSWRRERSSPFQPSTAWCLSGPSGPSATSPAVKDTPFGPVWSNWSRSLGAALVPRPSRGRNARSESAGTKRRRREEVEVEVENEEEEEREGDAVNREEMQRSRSNKVGGNDLQYCHYY